MNNADQPINPQNYNRCGNGDNDFEPLVDGKKTGYERKMAGLTKREYFAGLAMQGIMANHEWAANLAPDEWYQYIHRVTSGAVEIADMLLKQLETK